MIVLLGHFDLGQVMGFVPITPSLTTQHMPDVVAVLEKQEMRRGTVSDLPETEEPPAEASQRAADDDAEKIELPQAKKIPARPKASTPKMPPKKKDDTPPAPAPVAKKHQAKPAADETTVAAPKSKSKSAAAASDSAKRPAPSEDHASKRVKTSSAAASNGRTPSAGKLGLQLGSGTIARFKDNESKIPPAIRAKWEAGLEATEALLSQRQTFKAWSAQLVDWVKHAEENVTNINTAALAMEFICRKEEIVELLFGLSDARCAAIKSARSMESQITARLLAAHTMIEHLSLLDHLKQILDEETSLLSFLHTAIASDTVLAEPFIGLLNAAQFKLGAESDAETYSKSIGPLSALAYTTIKACEKLWKPNSQNDAEEEPEPEPEEEEFSIF